MTRYTVEFAEPHAPTGDDGRTLTVSGDDDPGSIYSLGLPDGDTRSIGRRLVKRITDADGQS